MISRHRNIVRIVERDGGVNEASVKISVSAIAGMVVSGRDGIGADQAMAGGIARAVACTSGGMAGAAVPIDRCISTDRRIAATAASAHPGDLHRTLMELSRVRLMSGGGAARARGRDVDGIKDRDGRMNHRSHEMAIATVAGAVVTARDHVGAGISEQADASAERGIGIAAVTADSGTLARRLIENSDIRLMRV